MPIKSAADFIDQHEIESALQAARKADKFLVRDCLVKASACVGLTLREAAVLMPAEGDLRDEMYAAARCVVCHRFNGEGGATGPDLSQAAGRFNLKDLCESIVEPSKVISDQYRAATVTTDSGRAITLAQAGTVGSLDGGAAGAPLTNVRPGRS